ncbi:MAG TPA: phosphoribosylanthranilate isomerase [Rhizomicrobium sp.]|nr:phosphoribosylanthranilate isomerase [Rhizomicrobium sp.]
MAIAVKICGITSLDAVDAAVAAGAAYGGLVFHPKSPRFVMPDQARALADRMRGQLKVVALVADLDDAALAAVIEQAHPDILQLHGAESARRVADIRARFGLPVIKALPIAEAGDFAAVPEMEAVADMLLFDARPPKGAERAGGHGAAFDWALLAGRSFRNPWFLAGGLEPGNVARALDLSGAALVDVSSGVERAPGVKDPARIADFVAATRLPVS